VALRVGARHARLSAARFRLPGQRISNPRYYSWQREPMSALLRPSVSSVVVLGLFFAIFAVEAAAQPPTIPEPPLIIDGRVLWVDFGSQTMALAPANGTPAISIDLRRLPQSDYQGFRGNEYVRVVGYVLRPSRRIQAFELYLVTPWYPAMPQSP